jgi:hypothetical protein
VRYGSLNAKVAKDKNFPFAAYTTIELKNVTPTSGNTCALVSWNFPRYITIVSLLSDAVVIFFN